MDEDEDLLIEVGTYYWTRGTKDKSPPMLALVDFIGPIEGDEYPVRVLYSQNYEDEPGPWTGTVTLDGKYIEGETHSLDLVRYATDGEVAAHKGEREPPSLGIVFDDWEQPFTPGDEP
jgi:hypothetical protein